MGRTSMRGGGEPALAGDFVDLYDRHFDRTELAQLFVADDGAGTTWLGSSDGDLHSVYHQSSAGVAVWVGAYGSDAHPPAAIEVVQGWAETLAAQPQLEAITSAR